MIIKLNLLGDKRKHEIKKNAKLIYLINNLSFLTVALAVSGILLLSGQQYLKRTAQDLEEVTTYTSLDKDIAEANRTINQLESIQKDYIKWSRVLFDFVQNIPIGNRINRVNFNKNNQKIVLNGFAERRENFLKLEEALEKMEYASDITSPISNLLKQSDISFSLEAKLNL